ncbi:MAG: sterol desaturase family protein [Saprospiraceae bacterium]|nr:sterol desaturase family protein [Saprospiraceae bacterium]
MVKNFVSSSTESIRMFKNPLLEAVSKVHFSVPLLVYVPLIGFMAYKSFGLGNSGLNYFAYFLLGLFIWTLTEYVLHKHIFHFVPKSKWGLRLHFIFHGVHHDYPMDRLRLVMPPAASLLIASLFYFFFSLFFETVNLYAFFGGFLLGYLFYDMTHYAIHHLNWKNPLFVKIKKHHMMHHFIDSTKGFGVSSSLWDVILGSNFQDNENKAVS